MTTRGLDPLLPQEVEPWKRTSDGEFMRVHSDAETTAVYKVLKLSIYGLDNMRVSIISKRLDEKDRIARFTMDEPALRALYEKLHERFGKTAGAR